jgi:hypothetical protein
MLIETTNPNSNWEEVMCLWSEICRLQTPDEEVSRKAKTLLIALWNEKDWLKSEFPSRAHDIEDFINKSKHLSVVADLANTLKHRKLNRKRSKASEVENIWRSSLTGFRNWEIGMIQVGEREFVTISALFVHSVDEFENLRAELYGKRSNTYEPQASQ